MVTLVTSPESSRNTYCTVAEGDAYHDERLHVSAWTDATTAQKESALRWASVTLDRTYEWNGIRTEDSQAMRWPRSGPLTRDDDDIDDDIIPPDLRDATAELARLLIEQDRGADPGTIGFESISVGPISLDVDKHDQIAMVPYSVESMIDYLGTRINVKRSGIKVAKLERV